MVILLLHCTGGYELKMASLSSREAGPHRIVGLKFVFVVRRRKREANFRGKIDSCQVIIMLCTIKGPELEIE